MPTESLWNPNYTSYLLYLSKFLPSYNCIGAWQILLCDRNFNWSQKHPCSFLCLLSKISPTQNYIGEWLSKKLGWTFLQVSRLGNLSETFHSQLHMVEIAHHLTLDFLSGSKFSRPWKQNLKLPEHSQWLDQTYLF